MRDLLARISIFYQWKSEGTKAPAQIFKTTCYKTKTHNFWSTAFSPSLFALLIGPGGVKWRIPVFIIQDTSFSKIQIELDLPVCFPKLLIKAVFDYDQNWKHVSIEVGPHAIFTQLRAENVGKNLKLLLDDFPLASHWLPKQCTNTQTFGHIFCLL